MKPTFSMVFILLLLLLNLLAQGFSLEEHSLESLLLKSKEGEGTSDGVIPCRNAALCSVLKNRKLMNKSMPSALNAMPTEKDRGDFHGVAPSLDHDRFGKDTYPDVLDIAGMDYSPAKRKPPIHN